MNYFYSLQSELLKTKRSASFWLSILGGFFVPIISLFRFLYYGRSINSGDYAIWVEHFNALWSLMSVLLPVGIILVCSLITQMEYKNNTWKQLHSTPQDYAIIFFAKFSVILILILGFFVFFNFGILLSGLIPCLIFDHQLPREVVPIRYFLVSNFKFFITCLPVIAIQYLIGLNYKNFLISITAGAFALVGSLFSLRWQYALISPYSYLPVQFIFRENVVFNIYLASILYFLFFTALGFIVYRTKRDKG